MRTAAVIAHAQPQRPVIRGLERGLHATVQGAGKCAILLPASLTSLCERPSQIRRSGPQLLLQLLVASDLGSPLVAATYESPSAMAPMILRAAVVATA